MGLVIIGSGALGRIALNIARLNKEEVTGFYDDNPDMIGKQVDGLKVKGNAADIFNLDPASRIVVGIGEVDKRKEMHDKLKAKGFDFAALVHPTASIASSAKIEEGCIIKENAVVEIGTAIGANSVIGNGAVICHDSNIGKHCRIAPSVTIAGNATVGAESYLCVGVKIDRRIKIGKKTIIASGCTIWKDVPAGSIVKLPAYMDVKKRG